MSTATIIPFPPESSESTAAVERYRHAYDAAQATKDFAETVKLGGIFVGGLFVVAATIAYQLARAWHSGFPAASLTFLACAAVTVLASRIWEKVLDIQRHSLEMTVDAAVNTSPFLSPAQRSAAMFLQEKPMSETGVQGKAA
jgi:hypothetical protein